MSELSELAENVKLNGIVRKDNWLDIEDEKKARDIIASIKPKKGSKKSWLSTTLLSQIIKVIKFDFKNLSRSLYFIKISLGLCNDNFKLSILFLRFLSKVEFGLSL